MSFFSALLDRKQGTGFIFWGLVTLRAVFNYSLPLMDKTEARYAEIARIMAETGNWVVPQIDYTIPFGRNHHFQLGQVPLVFLSLVLTSFLSGSLIYS